MKKAAGSIALLGGGEWTEPYRGARQPSAAPGRVRRGADRPYRRGLRAPGTGRVPGRGLVPRAGRERHEPAGPEPPRRRGRRERRRDAGRPVHLPRRRLSAPPALGAEGQPALRRPALRPRPGCGHRRLRWRCDLRVRPDGRSPRWRLHGRARHRFRQSPCSRITRARPTTGASAHSSCSRRRPCSWASTGTLRSCARRPAAGR